MKLSHPYVYSTTFLLLIVVASLLTGCVSMATPKTNLERLAYLEISYGVVLDKATLYSSEGRLSAAQKDSFTASFDAYEKSRNLAKLAIDINDQGSFDSQTAVMTATLVALRTLVAETEQ